MPAEYVRMLAYAWGEPVASRTCLLGETFSPTEAYGLGMVHQLVPAEELLDRAVAVAEQIPADCLEAYALTKRACQAAALRDIAALADPLDGELPDGMTSADARHAHRRYWQQLKGRPAPRAYRAAPGLIPGSAGRFPTPTCWHGRESALVTAGLSAPPTRRPRGSTHTLATSHWS